ncbi:MAG: dTDP-Rha--alpha-D-GlcNAc-pyrophosphate polyprenol alpha-3-L-rhamnosyltransferase, partial [Acidimicrobiia bacterium]
MDRVDVAAVVVNFNAGAHLLTCVRSLRDDGVGEIVVVDNASSDGSLAALTAADPGVRILPVGVNLGFGAAANRGVAATTAPFVAVMNPDVVVEPGTTKALTERLAGEPTVAVAGPRVENPDGTWYPSARSFPSLADAAGHAFLHYIAPRNRFSRRYRLLDWDHASPRRVDWVSGTFMVLRRSAFEDVGGFDESYFMYVEDVDLCWRLRRAGWEVVYEPAGRVVHTIGVSSEHAPYRMILEH